MNQPYRPLLHPHPDIEGKNLECISYFALIEAPAHTMNTSTPIHFQVGKLIIKKGQTSTVTFNHILEKLNANADYISTLSYPQVMILIQR